MSYTSEKLYQLLPAIYRQRDAEHGYPLRALVEIIAEQATILEADITHLYDNWFIETCDPWVVPYIGDLVGMRGVHPAKISRRAETANTIGYRRRKGTASVLEQLARDATGWGSRVVEFFELLSTTQHINHIRLHNHRTPDLRQGTLLEYLNGPFDTIGHTAEVRRIENNRGHYNIPNVGIFSWRLDAFPLTDITPHQVNDGTGLHYTFSVLGNDTALFNHPVAETSATHIAEEINVPTPIRRRGLHEKRSIFYGRGLSIEVKRDGNTIPPSAIIACDLTDWTREPPPGKVAIDPALGRLSFSPGEAPIADAKVSYYYGFSAPIGGGEYERASSFTSIPDKTCYKVGAKETLRTIGDSLKLWEDEGKPSAVIEIEDSGTYSETINVDLPEGRRLEIRAANEKRPTLLLASEMQTRGEANSEFELNGLLLADNSMLVSGNIERLRLQHCTFVPGLAITSDCKPIHPSEPSLVIEAAKPKVMIATCILGAIKATVDAKVEIRDSILDSNDPACAAYIGLDNADDAAAGPLKVSCCTVNGKIHTKEMVLGENSIFIGLVASQRRQQGCMRFSYVRPESLVPKRFCCQPAFPPQGTPEEEMLIAAKVAPRFTSLHYGFPGYYQLAPNCPIEIRRGAEDESEMGAFSSLQQPQREDNLRLRLGEYLRFGLEAGVFYAT